MQASWALRVRFVLVPVTLLVCGHAMAGIRDGVDILRPPAQNALRKTSASRTVPTSRMIADG